MKRNGFTLVELMLVVAILGILGALVLPVYQGHASEAKVSAAKSNIHTIRAQIELYKLQHLGFPPGYVSGSGVAREYLAPQLEGTTAESGYPSGTKTSSASYPLGPYLLSVPENPFNGLSGIDYIADPATLSTTATGETYGWYYHQASGTIYLNWPDQDEDGVNYYDY